MIDLLEKGFDFNHMFERMPIGMLVYSVARQKPLKSNQALLRLFDADTEEDFLMYGPFSNAPRVPQPFGKLQEKLAPLSRNESNNFTIETRADDGSYKALHVTTFLVPALQEPLLLLLFLDGWQKRESAQELLQSQKTLEAVINTAVDGIIIINENGIMQMVNRAASQLFGYDKEEMHGQNVHILMPSPHTEQHNSYINNYLKSGIGKIIGIGREVEGLRKDGSRFPFKLGVSRVELEGKVLFAGVVHDLTEKIRL